MVSYSFSIIRGNVKCVTFRMNDKDITQIEGVKIYHSYAPPLEYEHASDEQIDNALKIILEDGSVYTLIQFLKNDVSDKKLKARWKINIKEHLKRLENRANEIH